MYAFTEHFVMPLSHDEVVHGKGSLISKMPGDDGSACQPGLLYATMWAPPGKKLLFMGGELAPWAEWNHERGARLVLLQEAHHAGRGARGRDLNALYRGAPRSTRATRAVGFEWIVGDHAMQSVLAFLRSATAQRRSCSSSSTSRRPCAGSPVGVPVAGRWKEIVNSDAEELGGSGMGNLGGNGRGGPRVPRLPPVARRSTLPPLSVVYLRATDRTETSLGARASSPIGDGQSCRWPRYHSINALRGRVVGVLAGEASPVSSGVMAVGELLAQLDTPLIERRSPRRRPA